MCLGGSFGIILSILPVHPGPCVTRAGTNVYAQCQTLLYQSITWSLQANMMFTSVPRYYPWGTGEEMGLTEVKELAQGDLTRKG